MFTDMRSVPWQNKICPPEIVAVDENGNELIESLAASNTYARPGKLRVFRIYTPEDRTTGQRTFIRQVKADNYLTAIELANKIKI